MNLTDPTTVSTLLHDAAEALRRVPSRRGCTVRLPANGRLLIAGDLHDNPLHLARLLALARLDAGIDRHLVVQELIHGDRLVNGVDLSHRILCRVAALCLEHPGRVHPLLGNHELCQLTGRGVSKGAGNGVELFDDGLAFVFGDDWEIVRDAVHDFIRAMPLAVTSAPDGDGRRVLCAHSVPGAHAMAGFDPSLLDRDLVDADYRPPDGGAYRMTWGRDHPPDHLAALADAWEVSLLCVGHRHVETGIEMIAPNAVAINSDHERAAALPVDLAAVPDAEMAAISAIPLAAVGQVSPEALGGWS